MKNKSLLATVSLAFLYTVATTLSASANELSSPGDFAYSSASGINSALLEIPRNVRRACQLFGQYEAYKSMATAENTDVWTLRNLSFNTKADAVLSHFCEGPDSTVSQDKVLEAARSIMGTIGLESMPTRP